MRSVVPAIYMLAFDGTVAIQIAPTLTTGGHSESGNQTPILFWTEEVDVNDADDTNRQPSMFSLEDSPARTTAWQDAVQDWLVTVARSGGKCIGSLLNSAPPGLLEKTFMDSPLADIRTPSERSSEAWWKIGRASCRERV